MRRVAYGNAVGKYIELERLDEARALLDQQIKVFGETPGFAAQALRDRRCERAIAPPPNAMRRCSRRARWRRRSSRSAAPRWLFAGRFRESVKLNARHVELLKRQGLPQRAAMAISGEAVAAAMLGQTDRRPRPGTGRRGARTRSRNQRQPGVRVRRARRRYARAARLRDDHARRHPRPQRSSRSVPRSSTGSSRSSPAARAMRSSGCRTCRSRTSIRWS